MFNVDDCIIVSPSSLAGGITFYYCIRIDTVNKIMFEAGATQRE